MKINFAIAAIAGIAASASANVTINEVSGSTPGSDYEFIELYNTSGADISLAGWTIELWESDTEASNFGMGQDGLAPFALSGSITAGGFWTIGNNNAVGIWGAGAFDQFMGANAIENSAYTMVLRDAMNNVVETIFAVDDDALNPNVANIAGNPITPDSIIGPDGNFVPGGYYRTTDGGPVWALHDFGSIDVDATPGASNVPAPGALALLGLGGLATARRRR